MRRGKALGVVTMSKVGAWTSAFGVRHMLRTTVAGSAIRVEKLRAGVPPDDESRYFHGNPALLTLAITGKFTGPQILA